MFLNQINLDRQAASRLPFELLSLELFMRPFEKLIRIAVQEGTEKTVINIKKLVESESD